MSDKAPSPRTRVKRANNRAVYDRAAIDAILDAGMICHVGYVHDGYPVVTPTITPPISPGPPVAATRSICGSLTPAWSSAAAIR